MREMPPAERPRERLLHKGADSLKTAELIAILLRTGTHDRPVLELADFLLQHFCSLEALSLDSLAALIGSLTPDEPAWFDLAVSMLELIARGAR